MKILAFVCIAIFLLAFIRSVWIYRYYTYKDRSSTPDVANRTTGFP